MDMCVLAAADAISSQKTSQSHAAGIMRLAKRQMTEKESNMKQMFDDMGSSLEKLANPTQGRNIDIRA